MAKKNLMNLKRKEVIEKKLNDYCLKGGHRLPQSRREFLASGILGFSATVLSPTVFSMIHNQALASEGCAPIQQNLPPFIQITLAGGAALCANFVIGDEKGELLSSYQRMGLGTRPNITRVFSNNAPFATQSGFLAGLNATASAAALAGSSFVATPSFTVDDTVDNEQNILGLVYEAGLVGQHLPPLLASSQIRNHGQTQVTNSRFFCEPAYIEPPSPLRVSSVQSMIDSLSLKTGSLTDILGSLASQEESYKNLMSTIANLSKIQMGGFLARTPSSEAYKKLMECSFEKNNQFVQQGDSLPNLDIEKDSSLSGLWLGSDVEKNKILGSVVLSALKKVSGPALIQLGGYDYHQGIDSRQASNELDKFAGSLVGKILESAKRLNTPVFIYITSDGSAFTNESDSNTIGFVGDRATHAMTFMIGYRPDQAPPMEGFNGSPSYQLNHFDKLGLEVNTLHTVGKSTPLSSASAFINYLAFAQKLDLINMHPTLKTIRDKVVEAATIESLLRFKV